MAPTIAKPRSVLAERVRAVIAARRITPRRWSTQAGLKPDTVRNILRGRSESPRLITLEKLADAVGIRLDYLRGEIDEMDERPQEYEAPEGTLPMIGYIGAGDQIFPFGVLDASAREPIPAPPGLTEGAGAVVRGDSMAPVYRNGDIVFAEGQTQNIDSLLGQDCFVQVEDGPLYLKVLKKSYRRGLYDLISYAFEPITGQRIAWAAPVQWVKRARPDRKGLSLNAGRIGNDTNPKYKAS